MPLETGFSPPRLQGQDSKFIPRKTVGRSKNGGPEGDRTHDLVHAMHALSQLSYRPTKLCGYFKIRFV